jgi:glutamine amidotransferase
MSEGASVAIVDYGMGNVGSIRNMLRKVGARPVVARLPQELAGAQRIVFPGVGAFDEGMARLESSGLKDALVRAVQDDGVPILGICLGMQLFTRSSEEGSRPGLGWIPASTVRFRTADMVGTTRLPHMGWNLVEPRRASAVFPADPGELRFYFLHSYHVVCAEEADVLALTRYGHPFVSAYQRGNVLGVQFHPEKSHLFGMDFFRRFVQQD